MYDVVSFTQKPFKLIQQGLPHAGKVRRETTPILYEQWVGSSMSHRIGLRNMACSSATFSE